MFQKQVATITRDHFRTHLREALDGINDQFAATDQVPLDLPKMFDTRSLVGGRAGLERNSTPALAIHCDTKALATDTSSMWDYVYSGKILGVFIANSADLVEDICERYGGAMEWLIRTHLHITHASANFQIVEMLFDQSQFFGAALVPDPKNPNSSGYWFDGFQIDLHWAVAENGPFQHDATLGIDEP